MCRISFRCVLGFVSKLFFSSLEMPTAGTKAYHHIVKKQTFVPAAHLQTCFETKPSVRPWSLDTHWCAYCATLAHQLQAADNVRADEMQCKQIACRPSPCWADASS